MLLIDDRAGSRDLVSHLPPELVRQIRLEAGDIAFFGAGPDGPMTYPIGIEYKTVGDAIQSMLDKRFVGEQYPKMSGLYKRIYVIIEGRYKEGPNGRLLVPSWANGREDWVSHGWSLSFQAFENWQNSLTETGKVIFKRSVDQYQTVGQILALYHMWNKDYDQHKSLFAFDASQTPLLIEKPTLVRLMASQLKSVGWMKSKAVAEAFESPYDMVTAPEEAWRAIKGIGKTLSHQIVAALRSPSLP